MIPGQGRLGHVDAGQADDIHIGRKHLSDLRPVLSITHENGFRLAKLGNVLRNICVQRREQTHTHITRGHDRKISEKPVRAVVRQEKDFSVAGVTCFEGGGYCMNLSAALGPRVVITAFALQITKPNLIGLLRSPLIKVSHERIVFEHLISRRCFYS